MIYIFLGNGFEEIEALTVADVLRRAELDVQLVGIGSQIVTGSHGISVVADITDTQANLENLQMIVLPGGMPGTLSLERSAVVQEFIDFAVDRSIWIGAICAAPSILGHKGLLQGKNAVCYPGFEEQLSGAKIDPAQSVVRDGKIITADGAGAAMLFALELVNCLLGEKRSQMLKAALQCR